MYENFQKFLEGKERISIIQAENPDGDSLGSALALDLMLGDRVGSLYCPVDIPKYLRYLKDWSRVTNEFDWKADGYVILDTASATLLSKLLNDAAIRNKLENTAVFVIDHHETDPDLPFSFESIIEVAPATADIAFRMAKELGWPISSEAAEYLLAGLMSDTLGLTSNSVSAETYRTAAELLDFGVNITEFEERRRDYMKKSQRILDYKADLIKRVQYHLDGQLATVLIPFDDIREYSDEYNPNVLILEELRLVEGVEAAVAIKTYPDGKLTGKIRASKPVAEMMAGYFGGGGHQYAAGFRVYEEYDKVISELVPLVDRLLKEAVDEAV